MMLGVLITLSAVALATILARDQIVQSIISHGKSLETTTRFLDAAAGLTLILIGMHELVG